MLHFCAYCKHHEQRVEGGQTCYCPIKRQTVNHWFAACRGYYRDRREGGRPWKGAERRRVRGAAINAGKGQAAMNSERAAS